MVEDALEGSTTPGKSKDGRNNPDVLLRLKGKQHYQLERFLKGCAANQENPYEARMAVLLWEAVRTQVECYLDQGIPTEAKLQEMVEQGGRPQEG